MVQPEYRCGSRTSASQPALSPKGARERGTRMPRVNSGERMFSTEQVQSPKSMGLAAVAGRRLLRRVFRADPTESNQSEPKIAGFADVVAGIGLVKNLALRCRAGDPLDF